MVNLHKIKVIENWICNLECGWIFKIWPTVLDISLLKDFKPWEREREGGGGGGGV